MLAETRFRIKCAFARRKIGSHLAASIELYFMARGYGEAIWNYTTSYWCRHW